MKLPSRSFISGFLTGCTTSIVLLVLLIAGLIMSVRARAAGSVQSLPPPPPFFIGRIPRPNLGPGQFSVVGQVTDIQDTRLTVKQPNDQNQTVILTSEVVIQRGLDKIRVQDIHIGDRILAIGTRGDNDDEIVAKALRIIRPREKEEKPTPQPQDNPQKTR
ncbi:MAG: hypothetical protein HY326_13970 [Chloroflexi bacterium]|nr:hypothetical protein [Chloroflexota bacterium]